MHVYASYLIFHMLAIFIVHCSFFFLLSSLMFPLSVESFLKCSPQIGYLVGTFPMFLNTLLSHFWIYDISQCLEIDLSLLR